MAPLLTPFIQPSDFTSFGSNAELVQNNTIWTSTALTDLVNRATRIIEQRCDRRLSPFTNLVETHRADGVDVDGMMIDDSIPLDLIGALGRSRSNAYGATSLVRDFWLRQFPPVLQDAWTYSVTEIKLIRPYGDVQTVSLDTISGPDQDTGHVRVALGTFLPPGSIIRIVYDGGYTTAPDDLQQACIFQCVKLVLLGAEPEVRQGMSLAELDNEITALLVPYVRY